ncbi:MAG: DUF3299 domain-containing protein [Roseibium sp.]
MKNLSLILILWAIGTASAMAAAPIAWSDLKDAVAARFEDPFETLYFTELRSIAAVYRLRQRLKQGAVTDEERTRVEERLRIEETKLEEAGVETDYLLSQREAILRRQREAALKGNPDLNGKEIAISGYVIPIISEDGTAESGYLVPTFGMCSHIPSPAPNQLIRYKLDDDWKDAELYKPVNLSGRLDMNLSRQTITLLDGQVTMIAAFDLVVTDIQPVTQSASGVEQRSFRSFKRSN